MEITQSKQNQVNVVALKGRLDANTSPLLESALSALGRAKETQVLVDCRELEYISSAGLRVLLAAAKALKKENGVLSLCALSPMVRQVFEISGFTAILPLYATREEALSAMA